MNHKIMYGVIIVMEILQMILCVVIILLVTHEPPVTTMENQPVSETEMPEEAAASETVSEGTTAAETPDAYPFRAALETLYREHTCCGRTYETYDGGSDSLEENRFAVYDVDGDGENELIILWDNTITASMTGDIFGKDSNGELYEEFSAVPYLTIYGNHVIEAGISHNQGYAGRLWPYTMYQYNAGTDRYEATYFVDAWDGQYFPNIGENPFPAEEDKCGEEILYYVTVPGSGSSHNAEPWDAEEYEAWHTACVDGTQPIEVPYVYLTPENIAAVNE